MAFVQFLISTAIGCATFAALSGEPNPKTALFGGLIVGTLGMWATTYIYVIIRWGRKTTLRWGA